MFRLTGKNRPVPNHSGLEKMLVRASACPAIPPHPKTSSGLSHGHSREDFLSMEHFVVHFSGWDLLTRVAKSKGVPQTLPCLSLVGGPLPWTKGECVCRSLLKSQQCATVCITAGALKMNKGAGGSLAPPNPLSQEVTVLNDGAGFSGAAR